MSTDQIDIDSSIETQRNAGVGSDDTPKKSRKPSNYAFTQQRLRAWQPILRPPYVIASFLLLTAVFIPLGVVLLLASKSVVEYELTYAGNKNSAHDYCTMQRNESLGGAYFCEGSKTFTVTKTMKPPIYVYYKLENFYQNHRRYADSRSDAQLAGNKVTASKLNTVCKPITYYGNSKGPVYSPCGLIAWSMFNDTFTIYNATADFDDEKSIVCDTATQTGCTKKGIAWASDRNVKFKNPSSYNNATVRMHPLTYFNESTHVIPDVEDEDFIVWMRTAALPNFRKLHRIIRKPIPAGEYELNVVQNYPVKAFGGVKSVVITTSSWIGGRNYFLAISYLVVGGITFTLAILFLSGSLINCTIRRLRGNA